MHTLVHNLWSQHHVVPLQTDGTTA